MLLFIHSYNLIFEQNMYIFNGIFCQILILFMHEHYGNIFGRLHEFSGASYFMTFRLLQNEGVRKLTTEAVISRISYRTTVHCKSSDGESVSPWHTWTETRCHRLCERSTWSKVFGAFESLPKGLQLECFVVCRMHMSKVSFRLWANIQQLWDNVNWS